MIDRGSNMHRAGGRSKWYERAPRTCKENRPNMSRLAKAVAAQLFCNPKIASRRATQMRLQ